VTSDPSHGWQRLGELLIRRRLDLDARYRNRQLFADERGIEYRIVSDIERARRTNFHAVTIAEIERAYALEPGAIGRFLDGGALETQSARATPPLLAAVPDAPESLEPGPGDVFPEVDVQTRAQVEAELPALHALYRMAGLKGRGMTGAAIFPASPGEAERWDRMTAIGYVEKPGEGYSPAELLWLMAWGRVLDDQYRAATGQPARERKALSSVT
jgi:hypothetical protein